MTTKFTKLWDALEKDIQSWGNQVPEGAKSIFRKKVSELKRQEINVMITGATGCGKSSTINALFDADVARVGVGSNPETMDIQKYTLDNLILWDSPGLGDSVEADKRHSENIKKKLREIGSDGNALIDVVLVILDGSSRDYGSTFDLINNVIIPNLGQEAKKRIVIAINQCDAAMKGTHWNREDHKPDGTLLKFLEDKVVSVNRRIKKSTGVDVEPIYYAAGYKEADGEQEPPYNLTKLLWLILDCTPEKKRVVYHDNISRQEENWKYDDQKRDYTKENTEKIMDPIKKAVDESGVIETVATGLFKYAKKALSGLFGGIAGKVLKFFGW